MKLNHHLNFPLKGQSRESDEQREEETRADGDHGRMLMKRIAPNNISLFNALESLKT